MFSFLRKRREQAAARETEALLAACATELHRTTAANWQFVVAPRDVTTRAELLAKAKAAGAADAHVVAQLAYIDRLLRALQQSPTLEVLDALITDAKRVQMPNCDAVRRLIAVTESAVFAEQGLRAIEQTADGRAVYLRCNAEFKNKPGQLEIREDGLCFRGEVLVELPWSDVQHAAETSHTYQGTDYAAVALQEGKRRTPTKFAFPLYHHGAEHACKVVLAAWKHAQQLPPSDIAPKHSEGPQQPVAGSDPWAGYGFLAAVGESQYQEALAQVAQDGRLCNATLVPEPKNPFDGNAVVVQIAGATVGYLCRADARRYQRRLLALAAPMQVPAKLIGGTPDKPSFGVLLDHREVEALPAPKRTRAKPQEPVDPTDQPF
jgi:hypothetical protein